MVPDRHLILHNQAFASSLHGCKTFFKFDLVKAYHQIPVNPADIPKSAVTTPFGVFELLTLPFSLRNAASTFQRFMDEVVRDLDFLYNYIDDILIASASAEEHATYLRQHSKWFVTERILNYCLVPEYFDCFGPELIFSTNENISCHSARVTSPGNYKKAR